MEQVRIWFPGQSPRKSNHRRILVNPQTKKPFIAKSEEAITWQNKAIWLTPTHAKRALGSSESPLSVTFIVWYRDRRPDLSIELALDALELAGVISNDRHAYEFHAHKLFSKHIQGIYAIVQTIEPGEQDRIVKRWIEAGDTILEDIYEKSRRD